MKEQLSIKKTYLLENTNRNNNINRGNYTGGRYVIDRAASDDVYNVNFTDDDSRYPNNQNSTYPLYPTPYVQVNNDQNSTFSTALVNYESRGGDPEIISKVHHSKFNSPSLRSTNQIVVGKDMRIFFERNTSGQTIFPLWRKVMFFEKSINNKILSGSSSEVYRIDSIASIYDETKSSFLAFDTERDHELLKINKSEIDKPSIRYSHVYIVPEPPSYDKDNSVIAKVYYSCDAGVQHSWYNDARIKVKNIKSSGLSNVGGHFKTNIDEDEQLDIDEDKTTPTKIGEIVVDDYSYYDFAKKKRVKGFGKNASRGDVVPYSFKGNYIREFNLSINSVFSDIKISASKYFETPYLDPSDGIVQMSIKSNVDKGDEIPLKYFDKNDIKLIRKDMVKSLTGLNRLSNIE